MGTGYLASGNRRVAESSCNHFLLFLVLAKSLANFNTYVPLVDFKLEFEK